MFVRFFLSVIIPGILVHLSCAHNEENTVFIQTVTGKQIPVQGAQWLSHEHILVDFIGAHSISPDDWDHDTVMKMMIPYLRQAMQHGVKYFVDATPAYLGRDVLLLEKIARVTGLQIITNTGFYGAVDNKYLPSFAFDLTPEELAAIWIDEFKNGIEGSGIKPGFIKISIDAADTLLPMHEKLVRAAAITHLRTGLTIASHTGEAKGLWPQLHILEEMGVSPDAFIWVHAQNEKESTSYLNAAELRCWISLDGLGWERDNHIQKLVFARDNGILSRVLISHDAGWFDPQKMVQSIQPYTAVFTNIIPALTAHGFSAEEINLLLSENPSKAFSIQVRKLTR